MSLYLRLLEAVDGFRWANIDDQNIMDGAWAISEESSINILSDKELMGAIVRVGYRGEDDNEFSANDVVGAWFGGTRDGGSTFSFDIVVDPTYQGKKLGRMLFDAGISEAHSCGAELISLEVVSDLSRAMVEKDGGFTFYGRVAEKSIQPNED